MTKTPPDDVAALNVLYDEVTSEISEFRAAATKILFTLGTLAVVGVAWLLARKSPLDGLDKGLLLFGFGMLYIAGFFAVIALHKYFRQALFAVCNIEEALGAFKKGRYLLDRKLMWAEWEGSTNPSWWRDPIFAMAQIMIPIMFGVLLVAVLTS